MEAYSIFSKVYDGFMEDIPYEQWYELVHDILLKYDICNGKILELACGSGNFTEYLAKDYSVRGIDISKSMLKEAKHKGIDADFACADMREYVDEEKYDGVVCVCDGVNYLACEQDIDDMFASIGAVIRRGGVMIFDLKKESYYETLGDSVFTDETEDGRYIWENYYDSESKDNVYMLTFFIRSRWGLYKKYEEQHIQHVFTKEDIIKSAKKAGLELVELFDSEDKVREYYILRRLA